jgi:hypothetical protein
MVDLGSQKRGLIFSFFFHPPLFFFLLLFRDVNRSDTDGDHRYCIVFTFSIGFGYEHG